MNSDSLVGFYAFKEYSGHITFNEKLDSPQTDSFSGGFLNADTYPLYSLCDTKNVNDVSGSGYFDSETLLQVGKSFPHKDWTIFVEYYTEDFSGVNSNVGRTLFSSMDSPTGASGFNIGLNGINKPYIEYKDTNGIKKIFTLNSELGKRNILSFSRASSSSQIEMSHHDFLYDYTKHESVITPEATNSSGVDNIYSDKALYIGDFFSGNSDYTGFSGHFNNLIIFNEHLSTGEREIIAKAIVGTDYSGARIEQETVYSTGITGFPSLTTGVTGSGITGYEIVSSGTIPAKCGDDFNLYVKSGVTGELTGSSYEFPTGTGLISGVNYVAKPAEVILDSGRLLDFKRKSLVTFYPFDSGIDVSETYCYTGIDKDLNKTALPRLEIQAFDLGDDYTGQKFIFYRNGVLQKSGVHDGTEIKSGDYYVSGDNKVVLTGVINEENITDSNVYDFITGDIIYEPYISGTGYQNFTGEHVGRDVYLNGKKLITLHNYNESTYSGVPAIILDKDSLNSTQTGELAFVPKKTFDARLVDGEPYSVDYNVSGFVTEIRWFNGQRLERNTDYLIISENSLLNASEFVRYNDGFSLYEGQNNGVE